MRIGFVIADENEYKPLLDEATAQSGIQTKRRGRDSVSFHSGNHDIVAVKAGIGKVNAATTAAFLIADEHVDAIINFGLSGAVSELAKDDIVAGTTYTECDFDLTAIGRPLGTKPQDTFVYKADEKLLAAALQIDGMKTAKCGCGDIFLADKAKKDLYKDVFGINEFDMETGAVASVCHDADIPFLAIRQISDTADDAAPDSYKQKNDLCEKTLTEVVMQLIEHL